MKAVAWVLLAVAAAAPVPAPPPPGPPNLGHIRPLLHLRGGSGGSDGRGAPAAVDGAAVPDAFNYESLFDGCRFGHGMIRVMNATAMDAFLRGELGMQLLRKEEYQRFGRVSVKLNDAAKDVSVCVCVCVCMWREREREREGERASERERETERESEREMIEMYTYISIEISIMKQGRQDDADGCLTWGIPEAQLRKGKQSAASSAWILNSTLYGDFYQHKY